MFKAVLALLVASALASTARADPEQRKIHIVDYRSEANELNPYPSYIFRGPSPLFKTPQGTKEMNLAKLHNVLAAVAKDQLNVTLLPEAKSYWWDFSLLDPTHPTNIIEKDFWADDHHFVKHFQNWPLSGTNKAYPPSLSPAERAAAVANNNADGTLWGSDDLASRAEKLSLYLKDGPGIGYRQAIIYVHDEDGNDAVSELISAYRLRFFDTIQDGGRLSRSTANAKPCAAVAHAAGGLAVAPQPPAPVAANSPTLTRVYAVACDEGSYCPTIANTAPIGWYCLWSNANRNTTFADCTTGYRCDQGAGYCFPNRC